MTDMPELVAAEHGLVCRRVFIEPEIYDEVLKQIFARVGFFCAITARSRCSAISSPRTFVKTRS